MYVSACSHVRFLVTRLMTTFALAHIAHCGVVRRLRNAMFVWFEFYIDPWFSWRHSIFCFRHVPGHDFMPFALLDSAGVAWADSSRQEVCRPSEYWPRSFCFNFVDHKLIMKWLWSWWQTLKWLMYTYVATRWVPTELAWKNWVLHAFLLIFLLFYVDEFWQWFEYVKRFCVNALPRRLKIGQIVCIQLFSYVCHHEFRSAPCHLVCVLPLPSCHPRSTLSIQWMNL